MCTQSYAVCDGLIFTPHPALNTQALLFNGARSLHRECEITAHADSEVECSVLLSGVLALRGAHLCQTSVVMIAVCSSVPCVSCRVYMNMYERSERVMPRQSCHTNQSTHSRRSVD